MDHTVGDGATRDSHSDETLDMLICEIKVNFKMAANYASIMQGHNNIGRTILEETGGFWQKSRGI